MATPASPTTWRRWLAIELRRLREQQGLAQRDAARRCGWSGPRLSYLENTQQDVVSEDLDKLLPIYGVLEGDRKRYYEAVQRIHTPGWWEPFEPLVDDWVTLYVGLEQGAVEIRTYEPVLVPGILQSEAYATAVMHSGLRRRSATTAARLVELRMNRKAILTDNDPPLKLDVVLDESVLHRSTGDPTVLRDQLEQLIELAERPNVTIRILPLEGGVQSFSPGPFSLFTFPWKAPDPELVFLERRGGALCLEELDDIERYTLAFDGLAELALSPKRSLATMRGAKEERHTRQ
jgi:transcriptional regulator with XRE-family HTH domain